MDSLLSAFLMTCCIILGVLMLLSLLRAIKGPRFTDRIVGINMIGTLTIMVMCILSVYFEEAFLVDIAVVYALLSFIAIVVLTRLIIVRRRAQEEKEQREREGREAIATPVEAAEEAQPGLASLVRRSDTARKGEGK